MKIVVAPNALKGSLSADEAAEAIINGFRRVPGRFEFVKMPVADGGDGILEVLRHHIPGEMACAEVADPLFRRISAVFFSSPQKGVAIVEMARASGLAMLAEEERDPGQTTSYGTGELIRRALDNGVKNIIVGIGGSATVDCGMGVACALGVRFLDAGGRELPPVGASLAKIQRMDLSRMDDRVKDVKIDVICDVDNPLLGPNGAARVYGPQKGASPEQVALLENGLANIAEVIFRETGVDVRNMPGAGAAGGVGGAMHGLFNAELKPGIDVVLELLNMEAHIKDADLVLTAEGRVDDQTVRGKAPAGVARLAKKYGVPCIALAGGVGAVGTELYNAGMTAVFSLCPGPVTLQEAMDRGREYLSDLAEQIARIYA